MIRDFSAWVLGDVPRNLCLTLACFLGAFQSPNAVLCCVWPLCASHMVPKPWGLSTFLLMISLQHDISVVLRVIRDLLLCHSYGYIRWCSMPSSFWQPPVPGWDFKLWVSAQVPPVQFSVNHWAGPASGLLLSRQFFYSLLLLLSCLSSVYSFEISFCSGQFHLGLLL